MIDHYPFDESILKKFKQSMNEKQGLESHQSEINNNVLIESASEKTEVKDNIDKNLPLSKK
jgi:hypothetical protein